ncbi:hypothetical protein [Nonomuraea sp. B1E8]|uniref:hypothetical protein n=1 Tax=unclassified Nonomuraea TaxID=2593643 RepID=UPI00325D638E
MAEASYVHGGSFLDQPVHGHLLGDQVGVPQDRLLGLVGDRRSPGNRPNAPRRIDGDQVLRGAGNRSPTSEVA